MTKDKPLTQEDLTQEEWKVIRKHPETGYGRDFPLDFEAYSLIVSYTIWDNSFMEKGFFITPLKP